jgi:membrane protease YdiL (CAAX protease family)
MNNQADKSFDWMMVAVFALGVLTFAALLVLGLGARLSVALFGQENVVALFNVVKGLDALVLLVIAAVFGRLAAIGFRSPVKLSSMLYGVPIFATCVLLALPLVSRGLTISVPEAVGWSLVALSVGLGEEILWRGMLYRLLSPLGMWLNALLTSAAFGSVHLLGLLSGLPVELVIAQSIMAAAIGLVFFAVRYSAGSLWTAVFLHFLIDAVAFVAFGGVHILVARGPEFIPFMWGIAAVHAVWGIGSLIVLSRKGT